MKAITSPFVDVDVDGGCLRPRRKVIRFCFDATNQPTNEMQHTKITYKKPALDLKAEII